MKKLRNTNLRLDAMALDIPEFPDHPNRVPFSGVLTVLDAPSDRPPAGAAGHRVVLPRTVAERALPSLLGMAVDYAPGLRGHDVRRKIGVITRAEIRGFGGSGRLEVGGYLFGKDFPEVLKELRAQRGRLGMSYEVTDVRVADPGAKVWVLENVVFTGAAILERAAAAYQTTSLAATAGRQRGNASILSKCEGAIMDEKIVERLDVVAQATELLASDLVGLRALVEEVRQAQANLAKLLEVQAASHSTPDIETRIEELARASEELRHQNEALRAQAERFSAQTTRKTVPPQVLALLSKAGVGAEVMGQNGKVDVIVLDKALDGLPVEQRIAVKSQLARAGAIE